MWPEYGKSAKTSSQGWLVMLAAVAACAFVLVVALASVIEAAGLPGAWLVDLAGHQLCHQLPERSLVVGPGPMAVCARCFALYLGGALALVAAVFGRRRKIFDAPSRWWLLLVAPSALDAVVHLLLGMGVSNGPRVGISIPAGFVLGLFLAEGINALSRVSEGAGCVALEEKQ